MNTQTLLIFAVLLVVAQAFLEKKTPEEWSSFKSKFTRKYKTFSEEVSRLSTFMDNLEFISKHNEKFERGEVTYKMAVNKFTDLTKQEFSELTTGFGNNNFSEILRLNGDQAQTFVGETRVGIPQSIDWRKKATGALEGQYFRKTGRLVSFSEQNLVDCSRQYNGGCHGGSALGAYRYIRENGGIESEGTYPYQAVDSNCKYKSKNSITKVKGVVITPQDNEAKLTEAIAKVGPITLVIDASSSFQHYSSGIFYDPSCKTHSPNHMVLAVGYGTENGNEYYIVKNSWSADWGENGYIRMARNKNNNCGVALQAVYPKL